MRWLLFPLVAALALLASGPGAGVPTRCANDLPNRLQTVGAADQLITVEASSYKATSATFQRWNRVTSERCFARVGAAWTARLGVNGLKDRRREGDGTTPTGVYGIGSVMYGSAPNPGVKYRYRKVVCGDWWVEDPRSRYYNTFRHVACGRRPPFRTNPPGMWQDPVAYRHLAVIKFNMNPVVPGRGSAIFLHVSKGRPTVGCISLPLSQLVATLRWLRPEKRPLIAIGTQETFARL